MPKLRLRLYQHPTIFTEQQGTINNNKTIISK